MSEELKKRSEIAESDKWDLSSLFADDQQWEKAYEAFKAEIAKVSGFQKRMMEGREGLLETLGWRWTAIKELDRIGNYAFLKHAADGSDGANQKRLGMASQLETDFESAFSYFEPQLMSIKDADKWADEPDFAGYRVALHKTLRLKDHILSEKEENILAMQGSVSSAPQAAFAALTNVDLDFGKIDGKPLTNSSLSSFLHSEDPKLRKKAYKQYYKGFDSVKQTIASLYGSAVKQDIFISRARGFSSCLEAPLFQDKVPSSVYENLIETVHGGLEVLHRFYDVKRRALGLKKLSHWDVYTPMVSEEKTDISYDQAVSIIHDALLPLGQDYVGVLCKGLTEDRWVDRYENKGKRSGAFSAGALVGNPFILISYRGDTNKSLFTLAHEGGHSMHSYYSNRSNPVSCANYTIFEAEVASTFNEQMLARYLLAHTPSDTAKASIISSQLDDIIGTLFRQTMFAEFELKAHRLAESGVPLTLDSIREIYGELLKMYFGDEVYLPEESSLEALRIPHFYRAFYVYKYSTGLSASIALSKRVMEGGASELADYLGFLRSGGSRYPIESLKAAGVDMSTPEPVKTAIERFAGLLDEYERLTGK
jgi:oligoendopeptidase F